MVLELEVQWSPLISEKYHTITIIAGRRGEGGLLGRFLIPFPDVPVLTLGSTSIWFIRFAHFLPRGEGAGPQNF